MFPPRQPERKLAGAGGVLGSSSTHHEFDRRMDLDSHSVIALRQFHCEGRGAGTCGRTNKSFGRPCPISGLLIGAIRRSSLSSSLSFIFLTLYLALTIRVIEHVKTSIDSFLESHSATVVAALSRMLKFAVAAAATMMESPIALLCLTFQDFPCPSQS